MRTWKTNTGRGPSNIAPPEGPVGSHGTGPGIGRGGQRPLDQEPVPRTRRARVTAS